MCNAHKLPKTIIQSQRLMQDAWKVSHYVQENKPSFCRLFTAYSMEGRCLKLLYKHWHFTFEYFTSKHFTNWQSYKREGSSPIINAMKSYDWNNKEVNTYGNFAPATAFPCTKMTFKGFLLLLSFLIQWTKHSQIWHEDYSAKRAYLI